MAAKLLVVSVVVLLLQFAPARSSSTYWSFYCTGGNYTAASQYTYHLAAVAAALPTKAASSPLLYTNESRGEEAGAAVYAVAQCRGDSSSTMCRRCVSRAFEEARWLCPFREGAFVHRDWCTVGYSTRELRPSPTEDLVTCTADKSPVTVHSTVFDTTVLELASSVSRGTVASPRRFATGQKGFFGAEAELEMYALGQCVSYLSAEDCSLLVPNMTAGRAAKLWCTYRFAPEKFFRGTPQILLANTTVPGSSSCNNQKKEKHRKPPACVWWFLGAAFLLVVAVIGLLLCWYRKKQQLPVVRRITSSAADTSGRGKDIECRGESTEIEQRPSALDSFEEISQLATSKEIVLFLDYDRTLAEIVNDPDKAFLSDEMHRTLQDVTRRFRMSIVSAIEKVFKFVGIDDINYAGSHGLDIKLSTATAESSNNDEIVEERRSYQPAQEYLVAITKVYNSLLCATEGIDGAGVENNKFCVSVHYRNVVKENWARVREVVEEVLETNGGGIKMTEGHMVYEIRPPTHWNKGDAVLYLLEQLGLGDSNKVFSIYIGDDRTDEDAFEAKNCGVGIRVTEVNRETRASYFLKNPSEVRVFLNNLVKGSQK